MRKRVFLKSPVRENCTPGSVRGPLGNWRSYRDDLVRLRASQINVCGHCIDMHAKDLRARGETEQRIHLLSAWRESPVYSARERAALAWTECITLVADKRAPDEVYEIVRKEFSELEFVNLTLAIVAINGWNRLNIAFGTVPGKYQPESS